MSINNTTEKQIIIEKDLEKISNYLGIITRNTKKYKELTEGYDKDNDDHALCLKILNELDYLISTNIDKAKELITESKDEVSICIRKMVEEQEKCGYRSKEWDSIKYKTSEIEGYMTKLNVYRDLLDEREKEYNELKNFL